MRNIGYSKAHTQHWSCDVMRNLLGGGFNHFFLLLLLGEMIQFDYFFSIYQPYTLEKFHKPNKKQFRKTSSFISTARFPSHICLGKYHGDVTRPKTAPKDSYGNALVVQGNPGWSNLPFIQILGTIEGPSKSMYNAIL